MINLTNTITYYLIFEWAIALLAFWNVRTAIKCMIREESKLQTCPKVMKFLGATIPMMLFFGVMIIKTAMMHSGMVGMSHLSLHDWLWTFADLNTVVWVYFGLKMVGDC